MGATWLFQFPVRMHLREGALIVNSNLPLSITGLLLSTQKIYAADESAFQFVDSHYPEGIMFRASLYLLVVDNSFAQHDSVQDRSTVEWIAGKQVLIVDKDFLPILLTKATSMFVHLRIKGK
jgi:hypothetical protein